MIKKSFISKEFYKPKDVSNILGVSTRTVQNYCDEGKLGFERTPKGHRVIPKNSLIALLDELGLLLNDDDRIDVIYARVSTRKQEQRGDLDRQVQNVVNYVVTKNPYNLMIVTDVASGLNDNRKGLTKLITLIQENKVKRVFVNYKDRLTRFGFNYIKMLCDFHNVEIVIVSETETDKSASEELAEDIISLIHSFSGKLYGLRRKIKDSIDDE